MDAQNRTSNLTERSATAQDQDWLWNQYSTLLKSAIEMQWGWDEDFQRKHFSKHLPYFLFNIVENESSRIAAYAVKTDKRRIYLHMLLVDSEYQLQGVGTNILTALKERASKNNLPIELSIFPANKVVDFYLKNSFYLYRSTDDKKYYRWEKDKES